MNKQIKKIEKIDLEELDYDPDRFFWDDDCDLGTAIRAMETKINQIIERLNSNEK